MKRLIFFDKKAKLTYILIFLCIAVFIGELLYGQIYGPDQLNLFLDEYGFSLSNLLEGNFYGFISSMFLHAGADHLILNMLALFFFGRVVENELGWKKFLLIFIASGIVGSIAIVLASVLGIMSASVPVIGASAAIFGIMGTAMLVKPFSFVFYPYLIPVPLVVVAVLYVIYNIADFVLVLTLAKESNISYVSHLGGLLAGIVFGFKQEGRKKGFLVLLLIIALMIIIPMFWYIFSYLELTNYLNVMTQFFS